MQREKGIALVLVLWVVVLLGVIAGAMSMTQRSGVAMVSNQKLEREGRALVDAGLNFMMLQLDNRNKPVEENAWPADGMLHPWSFAGHRIWIGAVPETARIDLNQADESLLLELLQSVGLEEERAIAVRDAILDWRDADDGTRPQGAEDDAYREARRPVGAGDGRFLSVEELQQVQGVSAGLYKKLAPLLTVNARQRTVNPAFASRAVLQAIPDLDPALLDQYLLERRQALQEGAPVPPPPAGAAFFSNATGSRFRLFARVEMPGEVVVQGESVIDIQIRTNHGYPVLRRSWGTISALGTAAAPDGEED